MAGLVWPEPHLLQGGRVDARQQEYRGWDDRSWQLAAERVSGRDLREVEAMTDQLAAPVYAALSAAEQDELIQLLEPLAHAASFELPLPERDGTAPAVSRVQAVSHQIGGRLTFGS